MAEKTTNNRVYTGLALFAILIVANLAVRTGRGKPVPEQTSQQPSPVVQVTTPLQQPAQQLQANLISTPKETTGIDEQVIMLNQLAENLMQRVASIPDPIELPVFDPAIVKLPTTLVDRFLRETPVFEKSVAATETTDLTIPQKETAIIGEFRNSQSSKFLVRENNRVFLVDETQEPEQGLVTVRRQAEGTFEVIDSDGKAHSLILQKPSDTNVQEAIKVLTGSSSKQISFNADSEPLASHAQQIDKGN
mgnify:CR=1 FL=1